MNENGNQAANISPYIRGVQAMADYLNVAEVTIRRAIKRHELPVVRLGNCLLFRRSDVEKTLEKLTVPSVAMVRERKARKEA